MDQSKDSINKTICMWIFIYVKGGVVDRIK